MSFLEIRHRTGRIETRELSREVPLLVGQLASNDIRIEADGVAPIHCRISWKQKHFEVAAVAPSGVQFNGTMVRQESLMPGDVIRVGDVEIVLLDEQPRPDGSLELAPISGDSLPVRSFHISSQFIEDSEKDKKKDKETGGREPSPHGGTSSGKDSHVKSPDERRAGMGRLTDVVLELDDLAEQKKGALGRDVPEQRFPSPLTGEASQAKGKFATPRLRPGERDPLRSPLVIGLLSGALILTLSALTLWFVLSRAKAQRLYDQAQSEVQKGQYAEAIESFKLFLQDYPRHALAEQARVEIGLAHVEQAIGGGSPAWDKGLEALQTYIDENRDTKPFQDPESPVRQFVLKSADKIAAGATETAGRYHRRPLLAVAANALKVIGLYSPPDNLPEARLAELTKASKAAEAAIVQKETFDVAQKKMDEALGGGQPALAFREYRHAVDRYSEAVEYRPLAERLKKACALECTLTARDDYPREPSASNSSIEQSRPQLTLTRRTRARTDVASVGATVFVLAEDCLFGVDSATGEPQWRQIVGIDLPFAPVAVTTGQPALLVCSSRTRELLLLRLRTGEIIWRLPLAGLPRGAPLVHEGQVYLATDDDALEQIDLQTGRSSARLKFTQKIVGPCAVSLSGERLYLPGHEHILYVLTRRPLACEQVIWLGHGPGSIQAPSLMMRHLLLLAENDRQNSFQLRLLDTAREDRPPAEIATQRIKGGHVHELPVLRGKELFVASSPERVSAFIVAETSDERALSFVASFEVKDSQGASVYLSAGPDGQLWMYSSALRRFDLTPDSLLPHKQELAIGVASQPLQLLGDSLYLGRRLAYSRAVLFAEADRQQMVVQWQLAVGAGILECSAPAQDGAVVCVTNLGDLFVVTPQKLARGGFEMQSLGQLPLPDRLSESLSATRLNDGRLAVYCAGESPRLWLPGADGMPREQQLPQALQAGPVRLAGGLLLALPGRLRLMGRPTSEPKVEDLPAPISQVEPPRWISLAAIDDTQAVVLSEQGRVARVRFGTAPLPHLEEITDWDAHCPVDLPLALAEGRLFLVDSTSRLVMLDANSLEPLAKVMLESAPAARPRPVGDLVIVELKTGRLVAYDIAGKLAKRWELPIEGTALCGDPLVVDGHVLVVAGDGRVFWLDAATGQAARTINLGQQLSFGPQKWGETIVVGTLAGALVVLEGPGDVAQ